MSGKMNSWNGGYENIPEPVKKLEKSVNFSCDHAASVGGGWLGKGDARPSSDDNQLGKGHPKGFAGKVSDNRADRNRSTKYGA